MKVVINTCHGGFGLSQEAIRAYLKRKGKDAFFYVHPEKDYSMKKFERSEKDDGRLAFIITKDLGPEITSKELEEEGIWFHVHDIERNDPDLVAVVEELGSETASGQYADLKIVEVPDDVLWHIDEYDGMEHVAENHRTWA